MGEQRNWTVIGIAVEFLAGIALIYAPDLVLPLAFLGGGMLVYGIWPQKTKKVVARVLPSSLAERWLKPPGWEPVGGAIRYIARDSQWAAQQPQESLYGAMIGLRQAAQDGEITIKGRKELKSAPNAYTREPRVYSQVWEAISPEYWRRHEPILDRVLSEKPGWQQTETEPENSTDPIAAGEHCYAGLRVRMTEVCVRWPKARK